MNENINLYEILKDCPEGTEFYSPLFGKVSFQIADTSIQVRTVSPAQMMSSYKFTDGTPFGVKEE